MLWIKAFHIVFVAAWFAGLFYLPRILVNLAMVPSDSHAERERLLLMGHKLTRFMTLLAVPAIALGLWLLMLNWRGYLSAGGWMHAKLLLVVAVIGYHHGCARLLAGFKAGRNRRSHRWFRVFNELSVLLFASIVVLVVVRPF
ncbi:MAG: CopD family protein [Inhella sp.]|jgi:putative membrane protein|nr:CopD family protein [Inhella sp.]